MSQTELGQWLGVTFQQIQKYEKGTNRISAGRLWEISQLFDTTVTWFFQDHDKKRKKETDLIHTREALKLIGEYSACSPVEKRKVLALIKAIAEASA